MACKTHPLRKRACSSGLREQLLVDPWLQVRCPAGAEEVAFQKPSLSRHAGPTGVTAQSLLEDAELQGRCLAGPEEVAIEMHSFSKHAGFTGSTANVCP